MNTESNRDILKRIVHNKGVELPKDYSDFLISQERFEVIENDIGYWHLASLNEKAWTNTGLYPLTLESEYHLNGKTCSFINATSLFGEIVEEMISDHGTIADDGEIFSKDRLNSAISIAEEENSDLMFIDTITLKVYALYHDDLSVQKLANNFKELIEEQN